ncbi:MAG: outer membrane beta-barrel protein [Cyclobacteriaceae bacterium]
MKHFLSILLVLGFASVEAQDFTLRGRLRNAGDSSAVVSATIQVVSVKDSLRKHYAVSDLDGYFKVDKLEKSFYKLKITSIGFIPISNFVSVSKQDTNIGTLLIQPDTILLEGVNIEAQIIPVKQRGDTTEYNALAYKTNPDANAEELLEKMPGIVIDNGTVQAQGENVEKVLVDGKEFFGNDPRAALQNIPAEIIDKIEVFDQASDQAQFSGFDDGETSKTVNIVTKSDMRNGQFGNVYAGYGLDEDRYHTGGAVNIFDHDRRISIIGQSNNINIQNFATEDLLGVVSGGSRRGRRGRGGGGQGGGGRRSIGGSGGRGSVSDFLVNSQGGISQTHALGINYSDKWGKKVDVSGSYFFNRTDNDTEQMLNQDFTTTERNYSEDNISNSMNVNHRMNMRLQYKLDDKNSIIIRPRVTVQENDGFENTFSNTITPRQELEVQNVFGSDLYGLDLSNNLLFRHRFEKAGRTASFNVSTRYSKDTGDSRLSALTERLGEGIATMEDLDQVSELFSDGLSIGTNLSYTEPFGEKAQLELSYRHSENLSDSDQETLDYSEGDADYSILNKEQSSLFNSKTTANAVGTSLRVVGKKAVFMTRLSFQDQNLRNDQTMPSELDINRSYFNLIPMAMLQLRPTRQKSLRVIYMTNTRTPSLSQLQDVVDKSNTARWSAGNPRLDQTYAHNFVLRYNSTNMENSSTLFAMARASFTQNYIGRSTYLADREALDVNGIIVDPGVQLSIMENMSGNRTVQSFMAYGRPIKFLKSNLNGNLAYRFSRTPGLNNGELNMADNAAYTLGATLSSNISEKVDFTLSYRTSFNTVNNSQESRQNANNNYQSQNVRGRLYIMFPKSIVFRSDLAYQSNSSQSNSFNLDFWIWNMSLGKKIFKNKRGEIKLGVADVLSQNQSIRRSITANAIQDVQTLVLQRYYMFTFTYKIRNFIKGVQNQGNSEDEERRKRFMKMREEGGSDRSGGGRFGGGGRF